MNSRSIIGWVPIALVGVLAIGVTIAKSLDSHQKVSIGGHELLVPRRLLLEDGLTGWLRLIPGLDDSSREILVRLPAGEVAAHVPSYRTSDGDLKEDVIARIVALRPTEFQHHLDPERLRDLWYRTGEYADAIVEEDRQDGLLKVFRRVEHPRSWALVSALSTEGRGLPGSVYDFWVAHCLDGRSSKTVSGRHTTCMTYAMVGDLMVEFHVSQQNVNVIDDVRQFLAETVRGWQIPSA